MRKKILFYGDSITDMCRRYEESISGIYSYGSGYVFFATGDLLKKDPTRYEIINRGVSGNRIVDLYARIKKDVWNHQPDVLSILIGINDIWHELSENKNGVDLERFEKVYRMLIEDTLERLPNIQIILCEPFVLHGGATDEQFEAFSEVKKYAKVVKKLAEEYHLHFLPLQEKLDEVAAKFGASYYLYDGVHPAVSGARLIADEWMHLFEEEIE